MKTLTDPSWMIRRKAQERYRVEQGKTCIDIRLKNPPQLFDSRDPAPFRERELDEEAVKYLLASAEDIPFKRPLKVVFSFSESAPRDLAVGETIPTAVRNHFDYEIELLRMQLKRTRRRGQFFMLLGLIVLMACLTLSQIVATMPEFPLKHVIYEGLIIGGWVAMWRPLDLLLFDWRPQFEKMKYCRKLADTEVAVVFAHPNNSHPA